MATGHTVDSEAVTEYRRGEFLISTSRDRLDLDVIHSFLTNCYWAKGIPSEVVVRSIEHALCFGWQVAYAVCYAASNASELAALDSDHAGRSWTVCAGWLHSGESSGAVYGTLPAERIRDGITALRSPVLECQRLKARLRMVR